MLWLEGILIEFSDAIDQSGLLRMRLNLRRVVYNSCVVIESKSIQMLLELLSKDTLSGERSC